MKNILVFFILISLWSDLSHAQNQRIYAKKGHAFFYWGWNRDKYTKSDIHFKGEHFDFTLKDVVADDRQRDFDMNLYFNPRRFTIPQSNFRIGYFFKDNYSLSFGFDHMKYVLRKNQTVKISGKIDDPQPYYAGVYDNQDIKLTPHFIQYEHTDGLNYINLELRRLDPVDYLKRIRVKHVNLNLVEGFGLGIMFPKTDATLMGGERNDEFHVAGFGTAIMLGLNLTFFNHFYLQTELKGGYINMSNVAITSNPNDIGKQQFFFLQRNFVFGYSFNLLRDKK